MAHPFAEIYHFPATHPIRNNPREMGCDAPPPAPLLHSPPMESPAEDDDDEGNVLNLDDLDENGFPILPFSEEEENGIAETSSFASDFHRAGTDWSSLVEEEKGVARREGKRSLVQRDLFQMWGVKREEKRGLVQRDLFQMWGIKKGDSFKSDSELPPLKRRRPRTKEDGLSMADSRMGRKSGENGANPTRACPFYKKIPGTPFTVDAFGYGCIEGCLAYFLSHFHYDHYGGLSKRWSHGPIYCTPLTARLLRICLSVNPRYICPLELNTEHIIEGVKVTMLEANHCPGAALIHFQLANGRRYLHTGDFRACKVMQSHPLLSRHHINVLYLDTTYCNPKYRFPSKEDVVGFVVRISQSYLKQQPKTLIIVGAYSIGKEHVYLALSHALGVPVYTSASRRRILESFNWPELPGKLCSSAQNTPLHVLPISFLRPDKLKQYLKEHNQQFTAVLAFRPTGWTYSEKMGAQLDLIRPSSNGNITIYGVPYSEHSSFDELKEFVQFLRPDQIIPTVNVGNAINREKMQFYFREWLKS